MNKTSVKHPARYIVGIQCVAVFFLALVYLCIDQQSGLSVVLGGSAAILPNIFFAWYFFNGSREKTPRQVVLAFYVGELVKLVLSIVLAILIFLMFKVKMTPFLVGLAVACFSVTFAVPFILMKQK